MTKNNNILLNKKINRMSLINKTNKMLLSWKIKTIYKIKIIKIYRIIIKYYQILCLINMEKDYHPEIDKKISMLIINWSINNILSS